MPLTKRHGFKSTLDYTHVVLHRLNGIPPKLIIPVTTAEVFIARSFTVRLNFPVAWRN